MDNLDFRAELTRAGAMAHGRWGRLGFLIRRYPLGAVGAAILAVFVLTAVFADFLTAFDAVSTNARLSLAAPDNSPILAHIGPEQDLPLLRPGDVVHVCWAPDASLVLPAADIPTTEDLEEMLDDS